MLYFFYVLVFILKDGCFLFVMCSTHALNTVQKENYIIIKKISAGVSFLFRIL